MRSGEAIAKQFSLSPRMFAFATRAQEGQQCESEKDEAENLRPFP